MKIIIFFFFVLFISCAGAAKTTSVFYPETGGESDLKSLIQNSPSSGYVVMGEFHYDEEIQKTEAQIINQMSDYHRQKGRVKVGWEFLNHTDSAKIKKYSQKLAKGEIDAKAFLKRFFKNPSDEYIPLLETVISSQAKIMGLNVPRHYKQKLITEGRSALPAHIIPPNMEVGSELYLERFAQAMGDHIPPEKLDAYFEAQCLTDSSMSHVMAQGPETGLNFLVAGSFHTDYFMGTVSRLKKLTAAPVTLIKIVNKDKMAPERLRQIKEIHPKYGPVADAIVIIE